MAFHKKAGLRIEDMVRAGLKNLDRTISGVSA
jgi:hypothetical protein